MTTRAKLHQCVTCPWKVGCDPLRDIPDYRCEMHESLRGTIAVPGDVSVLTDSKPIRIMACHYSEDGNEFPCAGWLHHQLGDGNSIDVRMRVLKGDLPVPVVEGEQHVCFDDTLPKGEVRR